MPDLLTRFVESGLIPDALVRRGIRHVLRRRLDEQRRRFDGLDPSAVMARESRLLPVVVAAGAANEQHYEVPADLFALMLGPRMKYSACVWESPAATLAQAEETALRLTCERAGVEDGMRVLDLGCGWGATGLWVAERYPGCRVVCVSNSAAQIESVRRTAAARGLARVEARRADVDTFEPAGRFDRVISVEMIEHVRNHHELLRRIAGWLAPAGRLFVHHFCHRRFAYLYEDGGRSDWMARTFFTGGMMPSLDLLARHDRHLRVVDRWTLDGTHYDRTLRAWLANLDRRRDDVLAVLAGHYGRRDARTWLVRWRLFLLACAELFAYSAGEEWLVAHYLFERSTPHD